MFFCNTRKKARELASTSEAWKFVDLGSEAEKRWAVKVL